jgi:C-terminal processing protease CtpA/Prc
VILACDGKPMKTVSDLLTMQGGADGGKPTIEVSRKQETVTLEIIAERR